MVVVSADQDSVRLLAVESCGAFAAALSKEDCASSLLPVVQKFAQVGIAWLAGCMRQSSAGTVGLLHTTLYRFWYALKSQCMPTEGPMHGMAWHAGADMCLCTFEGSGVAMRSCC